LAGCTFCADTGHTVTALSLSTGFPRTSTVRVHITCTSLPPLLLPLLLPLPPLLRLLQIYTLNRRVQAQNRVPDDFPGFIREGFDLTVIGEGYQIDSTNGWVAIGQFVHVVEGCGFFVLLVSHFSFYPVQYKYMLASVMLCRVQVIIGFFIIYFLYFILFPP
jgi:hypothetical protein